MLWVIFHGALSTVYGHFNTAVALNFTYMLTKIRISDKNVNIVPLLMFVSHTVVDT